jgi:hypothetical protein
VAMIPTSAKNKAPPERTLTSETPVVTWSR